TINSANVVNAGSISADGLLSIQNNNSVSVSGDGSLAGASVSVVGSGGSVTVSARSIAGPVTRSSPRAFCVTLGGGRFTAGTITAGNGSLSLVATSGALAVDAGSVLTAHEGNLILQTSLIIDGSISIGQGATLNASTTGTTLGRIYIVVGAIPDPPVPGT